MAAYTSTILITGGTTGLGYYAALSLAQQFPGAKIIIASRTDKTKAADTINSILQKQYKSTSTTSIKQVEYLPLDLSSTTNIRTFVTSYASQSRPPITALLLNAGLQYYLGNELNLTPDGIESTFAVNHVGHALLFFLLKPHLAPTARIVLTASGLHDPAQKSPLPNAVYETAELLAHPIDKEGYATGRKGIQRYSSSKLTNVLFSYALDRRLRVAKDAKDRAWTVCAMDPGLMPGTNLGRDTGPVILWIFNHVAPHLVWLLRLLVTPNTHLPQHSGANLAKLAAMSGEDARRSSGSYFEGVREIESSVDSHDEGKQEDLWRWTVGFLARDEEEKRAFEMF